MQKRNEDILPYIKKYIMKEKRVKYLALKLELDKDLSLLKDEVKEFGLYNIKIQNCAELSIYCHNFIKEMY